MPPKRIAQTSVVVLAALLVAFLFFNGRNSSTALSDSRDNASAESSVGSGNYDFAGLEEEVRESVPALRTPEVEGIYALIAQNKALPPDYAQLAEAYYRANQYILAGRYYMVAASLDRQNAEYWAQAGHNYFQAQSMANDSASFVFLVQQGIKAYEEALKLNPADLDAKVELAAMYVENSPSPMKGIGLLREVEQVDPTHRKALWYLAIFSLKSNQTQKAVDRLEKLTSLPAEDNPDYPFYFRTLSEAYFSLGDRPKALEAMRRHRELVEPLNDRRLKDRADADIQILTN